jgi:serine/threonine protein kinase
MVEDHEIYVMDWGNAAVLVKDRESCVLKDTISGTPGYLSPEAVRGECMDFRSEVFSLGLILFEIITLSRAFTGKNSHEILLKILDGKRNPIRHRFGLPIAPALRKILKKALDPLREKRYSSASALAEDLRSYLNGYPDL